MRVCLLTDVPDHPLLAGTAALLTPSHRVCAFDPDHPVTPSADPAAAHDLADVYLLKAASPRALALAHALERRGATVVNTAAATERCQDRARMAAIARAAGLPFAPTRTWVSVAATAAQAAALRFPLVAKSRRNRRGELVARLDTAADLRALAGGRWGAEPVVTQDFAPNDGFDRKVWVIGGRVFAALRPSPLGTPPAEEHVVGGEAAPDGRPRPDLAELAWRVGETFGLEVFGVDVLDRGTEPPVIVDVNAFPGVRGQRGAAEALASLVLRKVPGRA